MDTVIFFYSDDRPVLKWMQISIMMFAKVSWSFLRLLVLYSFFFIGFGFGFYILLDDSENSHGLQISSDDNTTSLFDDQPSAIVKSFVMATGEIDFEGMTELSGFPKSSSIVTLMAYLFVILFIFMVVITLMNLLNSIAIQDTSQIREQSDFLMQVSRLDIISNYERSTSLIQYCCGKYCFRNSGAPKEAFLFHPASEDRYVRVNTKKQKPTLDIFCCRNTECNGNSKGLKLTKQNLSQLKLTRESLIRRHNRISVNEGNEPQHVWSPPYVSHISLLSPKVNKQFFE